MALSLLIITPDTSTARPLRRLLQHDYQLTIVTAREDAIDALRETLFRGVIACHAPDQIDGPAVLNQIWQWHPRSARLLWTEAPIDDAIRAGLEADTIQHVLRPDADAAVIKSTIRHAVERLGDRFQPVEAPSDASEELQPTSEADLTDLFAVLMRLLQLHSASLAQHAHRVAALSRRIAYRIELPPNMINQIDAAAILHDVGKVLIDPKTIRKPASLLTPEERSPMRKHPEWGEQILNVVPSLQEAAEYVRHHHEEFDGSGYPDGLPSCQIPLGSRIIAVANAYDNIHKGRSVFRSRTPAQALDAVRAKAPEKYDPALIDVLEQTVLPRSAGDMPQPVALPIDELEPGMCLGQDFAINPEILLLARGATLNPSHIDRIQQLSEATPSFNYVLIYKDDAPVSDAVSS
jgi:response regulator RpfG family c-di-GMP phosphodiesterase